MASQPDQGTQTNYTYWTAPSGPPSINDDVQARESADHCLPHLLQLLDQHDGFLVACYSNHPLVQLLSSHTQKPVVGIFQSSVTTTLQLLSPSQSFGIVSTGKIWEELLGNAVYEFLGLPETARSRVHFAGVETTGLNATDLHDAPTALVRRRLDEATVRLLNRDINDIRVICLGCAGMAGMDEIVRKACIQTLGLEQGTKVKIVDGVKAGVGVLQSLVRGRF